MTLTNKFMIIAVILVVTNYALDGFIWQQVSKVDITDEAAPIACVVGAYMYSPSWGSIPMPATDDVMFAVIGGLVILGFFSAMNRPLSNKQKLGVFFLVWIAYKLVGYLLMTQDPNCPAFYSAMEETLSPLGPLFLLLAIYAVWKVWMSRRR